MPRASLNKEVTFKVYIDWDVDGTYTTAPAAGLPVGDDISRYIKTIDIQIGNDKPDDMVSATGEANLTLNNADRYFSPSNTSSPLYGKLNPRVPIRIDVTDGSQTWTYFKGFVSSISPDSGTRQKREAFLAATDYLGILERHKVSMPMLLNKTGDQLVRILVNLAIAPAYYQVWFMRASAPTAGHYIEVAGIRYTFQSSISAANDVLIPTGYRDRYTAFEYLRKAVNGEGGSGTYYHAGTTRPDYIKAALYPSYFQQVLDDRAIRYYRMGEASGTVCYDFGLNGANGTYTGTPTLGSTGAITGDTDTAVTLNGSTQYVTAPTLDFAGRSWTIVTWIKPAATPPVNQDFFSIHASWTAGGAIYLRLLNSGVVYAEIYGNGSVQSASSAVAFGGSNFYMIALTYDAITSLLSLYINGVLVASATVSAYTGSLPVIQLGAYTSAGGNPFKGVLDDTEMYFEALDASTVLAHYTARTNPVGLLVTSLIPGSDGDFITSASGFTTNSLSSSNALTGVMTLESGVQTFDYAGDTWGEDKIDSLSAIEQVTQSEAGGAWFYQDRDGSLYWRNRDYLFTRSAATVVAKFRKESLQVGNTDVERVYNRIVVSYIPRGTVASGVVAKANGVISVPGTGTTKTVGAFGITRNAPDQAQGNINYKEVDLSYRDPSTGAKMAVTSLVLPPEPLVDWVAGENTDDESNFYNNFTWLDFTVQNQGPKAKLIITNTAKGALKIFNFQLRGTGLARYEKTQIVREDATSIARYQRRILNIDLPLPVDPEIAESIASYLLNRFKDPFFEVTEVSYGSRVTADGYNVYDLKIGDVIEITDTQFGVESLKHQIIGIKLSMNVNGEHALTHTIRRIDDQNYMNWDDSTYGVWDVSRWTI